MLDEQDVAAIEARIDAVRVPAGELGRDPAGLREPDVRALADRGVAQGLGDVGLADPDRLERGERLAGLETARGGRVADLGRGEIGGCAAKEGDVHEHDEAEETAAADTAAEDMLAAEEQVALDSECDLSSTMPGTGTGTGRPGSSAVLWSAMNGGPPLTHQHRFGQGRIVVRVP